jgi:hypothetical protein
MPFNGVVPAVDYTEAPFGLANSAVVINHDDDEHWVAGFEQENGLCGVTVETWEMCGRAAGSTVSDTTDGDRWNKVYPFYVAAEDQCATVLSAKRPESQTRLLNLLDAVSIKAAEHELWTGEQATSETNDNHFLTDGTATSAGTGLSPLAALAAVEETMAVCMPGVRGVIHMSPRTATYLGDRFVEMDGKLYTPAGSSVVIGQGYAGQSAAIFGTGTVIVHLGKSKMVTDDLAQAVDTKSNTIVLRAERPVAVTWDGCCHVGATVTYS